ncbi:MAG: hypothetical protein GWN73_02900 [Actinobacteria bacterium]|nr:hypothetical protein [Actinomycetota bacterium]NIW26232.1 hypothetical protein [Actinomycetota bacterium]
MDGLDEIDVSHAAGTWKVKVAAALLGVTAALVGFTGVQLFTLRFTRDLLEIVPWVHVCFSAALIALAAMTYRARTWAAVGGTTVAGLTFFCTAGWQLYAMAHGVFSLLGLATIPAALAAAAFSAVAISDAGRATAVRKRLDRAGLNLGL